MRYRTGVSCVRGSLWLTRWAVASAAAGVPKSLRIGGFRLGGEQVAIYEIPVTQRTGGQAVTSEPKWFYLTIAGGGFD